MKCRATRWTSPSRNGSRRIFELKLSGRDLLAENIDFKQFPTFTTASGTVEHREQVTKSYNPGRSFFLTVVAAF